MFIVICFEAVSLRNCFNLIKQRKGWNLQIVKRSDDKSKVMVLQKRWIAGRIFSWFENFRKLAKDY